MGPINGRGHHADTNGSVFSKTQQTVSSLLNL